MKGWDIYICFTRFLSNVEKQRKKNENYYFGVIHLHCLFLTNNYNIMSDQEYSQYILINMNSLILFIILLFASVQGLDNGLGLTPPMGWNSWNKFGCNVNQTVVIQTVQKLISTGLKEKGYTYVNLDDCWQISRDPLTKQIQYDKQKFPSGIQYLINYIHSKGLLFGLYSDAGSQTCQGRPGSYGYENIDAKTYAKWEVDYLKYDNCHNQMIPAKVRYPLMRNALNATKRPIYFSMCEWGRQKPYQWAQNVSNSWRTTMDIKDIWESFIYNLERQEGLSEYAGPGAWNDPDMLEVGNGGMNHDQYQSHFALWAILKSPLLIGCDLDKITESTLTILGNVELIAVNQDQLGKQGDLIERKVHGIGYKEIWGGELSKDRFVVAFFNRSETQANFEWNLKEYFKGKIIKKIREIILHSEVQVPSDLILRSQKIKRHAISVFVIQF